MKSADDKTIMMIAASSGDAMTFKTVADACEIAIAPKQVCMSLRHFVHYVKLRLNSGVRPSIDSSLAGTLYAM